MAFILNMKTESGASVKWFIPFKSEISHLDDTTDPLLTYVLRSPNPLSKYITIKDDIGIFVISMFSTTESWVKTYNDYGGNAIIWDTTKYGTGARFYAGNGNYIQLGNVTSGGTSQVIEFFLEDGTALGSLFAYNLPKRSSVNVGALAWGLFVDYREGVGIIDFGTVSWNSNNSQANAPNNAIVNAVSFTHKGSSSGTTNCYGPQGAINIPRMIQWFDGLLSDDPNAADGDESQQEGGTGDLDDTSDVIGIPELPGISAVDTGFVTLYNPSLGQLRSLSSYMWTTNFLENIVKLVADPMDAILGLSIVPVAVPNGGEQAVRVGNVITDVTMTKAAAQYISFDCGSINMNEYWGSALDYAPNTKIQIYLPYIGYKMLDPDEVMSKTLGVIYHIDILTGACVAYVHANGSVLYQWEGNCACNLPVTGTNWSNIISAGVRIAGTAAVMASGAGSITAGTLASGMVNVAGNVMGAKAVIEHGGTSSGSGGQMAVQYPYLIVERPRQSLAKGYNSFEGYPSNITSTLGSLVGYTAVESIHLEGINATDAELAEIESLLKGGVIL